MYKYFFLLISLLSLSFCVCLLAFFSSRDLVFISTFYVAMSWTWKKKNSNAKKKKNQAIVADVCVVSEHVDALAETASCRAGHAAKLAENRKRQKYGPACQQLGLGFLPLAIESDGAFGKGLQDFIARCNSIAHGTSIAGTTWAASSFSSYWRQRISVCHRRGTARAVQRCLLTNCLARSGGTLADFSDFVDPHLF